jgi:hypothetical protein
MVPGFLKPTVRRAARLTHAANAAAPTANQEMLLTKSGATHPKKSRIGITTNT